MTDSNVITKPQYDAMKKRADELGIKFHTKYRKGLKNIKVEPIILDVWKEEAKLVAPEPARDVFSPNFFGNDAAEGFEHVVTDLVPVGVVDFFKFVEVAKTEAQRVAVPPGEAHVLL